MYDMLTIVTDVRGVCPSVSLSVTRFKSTAARAVYDACRVRGVIQCSLCQMSLASCFCLRLRILRHVPCLAKSARVCIRMLNA